MRPTPPLFSARLGLLRVVTALVAGAALSCMTAADARQRLPRARPELVGMDSHTLSRIDEIVAEGLRRQNMPGAVVLIARRGQVVYQKAFGHKQLAPVKVPMTTGTVFDMASITKPVATATSIMVLMDQGRLHPRDKVSRYIPEFENHGKESITLYQLLTHQSGLIADNALQDYDHGPAEAMKRIYQLTPVVAPGSDFIYSDVGFIVLGEIVSRVSGDRLDQFARKHIFDRLGMADTQFLPSPEIRPRCAPTQQRNEEWMQGEVHDPRAYRLGGVAGHAGLFSTAADLALYGQMMMHGGQGREHRILRDQTVQLMTAAYEVPGALRGLGWDKQSGYSSNRGDLFTSAAFGHGGFTGTVLWIDPHLQMQVIFLSNRVHPNGKGSVNRLAGRICTVAVAATLGSLLREPIFGPVREATRQVHTGIDVLQRDDYAALAGQRVGLITNHTGVNAAGISSARLLHQSPRVELVSLFSPEHGFSGQLDMPHIDSTTDQGTGLTIHSLYGETRVPSKAMLAGLDTLVFDIQDIGTRFYTYVSTMGYAMRAAAAQGIRFVVLDRPNPINGTDVEGPVLDEGSESFVGVHPLPIRHGMTVGELARLLAHEWELDLDLQVVPIEGWRRSDMFDATNLTWINPSPNMRSLTQALLYPGIGILETTNLSVGRGTDTPFELVGAPWIDGRKLARVLNASRLPGVRFVPVRFTPTASKHQGKVCHGVNVVITKRAVFQPVRTGLELARQLQQLFPDNWETTNLNRLLGNQRTLTAILAGKAVDEMELGYGVELDSFIGRRSIHLLYD